MLSAVARFAAAIVPATVAAAATAGRQRARIMRLFIWKPPESGGPVARFGAGRRGAKVSAPQVGKYHVPLGRIVSQRWSTCQYQIKRLYCWLLFRLDVGLSDC